MLEFTRAHTKFSGHSEQGLRKIWISSRLPRLRRSSYARQGLRPHIQISPKEIKGYYDSLLLQQSHSPGIKHQYTESLHECIVPDSRRINKDCKDLAVQLNQMGFSADSILWKHLVQTLLWVDYQRQVCINEATFIMVVSKSARRQAFMTNGLPTVKDMVYTKFGFPSGKNFWNMLYSGWKSECAMDSIPNQGYLANPFHTRDQQQKFSKYDTQFSPHATVESFRYKTPSLFQQATGRSLRCKAPNLPQYAT